MTREADIENAFVAWVEQRGGMALKLRCDGRDGFPDRTVLMPGGEVLFLEFKRPGGKLRPQQRKFLSRLRRLGFVARVVRSVDEAKNLMEG